MDKYICRKCKDNMIKQCLLDFSDGYPPCSKLSEVLNPAPNSGLMQLLSDCKQRLGSFIVDYQLDSILVATAPNRVSLLRN